MIVRKILCLTAGWLIAIAATGQYTDAGFWTGIDASYDYSKRLSFKGELQTRFAQMFSRYNTAIFDLGGDYELNDYFRFGAAYRFGHRLRHDDRQDFRHRFNTDLRLRLRSDRFKYDFRIRYQAGRRNTDERIAALREAIRYKARVKTKIMKKTDGGIAFEIFQGRRDGHYRITDWRVKFEIDRKLKKRQYINFGYLIQSEVNRPDPLMEHMIFVNYEFGYKRKKKKDQ